MLKETVYVLKVGGNVIEDELKLETFLKSFASLPVKKVLIHGGGKVATKMATQMGIKSKLIDGRRLTDSKMLEIVTMAYGGKLNKNIAAKLLAMGQRAVGLSGIDGGILNALKRPVQSGIDYGFVGDVIDADPELIQTLLNASFVPVIAPLTADSTGQILNTNADTIANEIAVSLSLSYQVKLIYVFELAGVMEDIDRPASLIKHISNSTYKELKETHKITDGMIPKLDNAFDAINRGVDEVSIVHFSKINELENTNFDEYTRIR